MAIHSLQVEKHVLSGLIKHPQILTDVAPFLTEKEFYDEIHNTIYLVIKSCFDKGERWDKIILAEKIKNLGVSFKSEINIYDYIDNLSFVPITAHAATDAVKELVKLRIRRDIEERTDEVKTFVRNNGNMTLDEIVAGADSLYGRITSLYSQDDQPQNLYGDIERQVEERGNNPVEETGLKTPYAEFNRLFGGIKSGHVYAFASRPGQGKSTLIEDICVKTGEINNTKAFVCDTEMQTEEIRWRAAAAKSGVPQWYVETGQWRKNAEMTRRMREALKEINKIGAKNIVTHYHVGNKSMEKVLSMIRRWHYANVKNGEVAIIAYDYLKLTTGDSVEKNWAEYQVLGEKIDQLKRLAEELNCVIITAIQLNRSGENYGKQAKMVVDDATAIAISDRLQWIAAFVAIFRRKTMDELAVDGPEFGSHKMIPLKTRFQGRDAAGHHDLMKRMDENGKHQYVNNYVNFQVGNFDVVEKGSLKDIIEIENSKVDLDDHNDHDGGTL